MLFAGCGYDDDMSKVLSVVFFVLAGLLLVWAVVSTIMAWFSVKNHPEWSMPFRGYVEIYLVIMVVPAVICGILGWVLHRRAQRQKNLAN